MLRPHLPFAGRAAAAEARDHSEGAFDSADGREAQPTS